MNVATGGGFDIASLPLSQSGDRHGGKRSADMPAAFFSFFFLPIAAPHHVRGELAGGGGMKKRKRRCSAKSTSVHGQKSGVLVKETITPTISAHCTHDARTAAAKKSCTVGLVVGERLEIPNDS